MEKPHKKLDVWKESIEIVLSIYDIMKKFPKSEEYGLSSQLKRAAISVPGNIAEGAARHSKREFAQFLYIARGSISEVDAYLEIAQRLGFVGKEAISSIEPKLIRMDKMLNGLIKSLKGKG